MKDEFRVMIEYKDIDNELYGPVYKAIKKLTKHRMGGHGSYLPTMMQDIDFSFHTKREAETFIKNVKKIKGVKYITYKAHESVH